MSKVWLAESLRGMCRAAYIEDGKLTEYHAEEGDARTQGDWYLGIVKNILPGMRAAFLDIGLAKNAYLSADDLPGAAREAGVSSESALKGLRAGQEVLVQVVREGAGDKGPRVSTHLTLSGRYVVLMGTLSHCAVSRKIEDEEERARLLQIMRAHCPEGMGAIARTAARDCSEKQIAAELYELASRCQKLMDTAKYRRPPEKILGAQPLFHRLARDMTPSGSAIVAGQEETAQILRNALSEAGRADVEVRVHGGELPLFAAHHLPGELSRLYARRVWLDCGGYIVIDHAEALTAIDVNTGKFTGKKSLPETILRANTEAAREIARQLRLRDIAGMILIDFIDMQSEAERERVLAALKDALSGDRTLTNVLGFTGLGLVEMTRRRSWTGAYQDSHRTCPVCEGAGAVVTPRQAAFDGLYKLDVLRAQGMGPAMVSANAEVIRAMAEIAGPEDASIAALPKFGARFDQIAIEPAPQKRPSGAKELYEWKEK